MITQPDYVSFEPKARDALLSRIGSFTPSERNLFQRLCESWAPVIDRARFLSRVGGSEQDQTALDRLMAKLRVAQIGLETTTIVGGKRISTGLVITSKADLTFFMHLIDEETHKLRDSGYQVLPSLERLAERKAIPPEHHVTDADSVVLADTYLADTPEDGILRVRLLGEYRILVSARSVKELINSTIGWLRASLTDRGLVDEVARVKNSGIMELRQRLSERAPDFWLDLCRAIIQERATIGYRKNLREDDEFFQSAFLIMNFTDAQIGAARARKETDTLVDEELERLSEAVERTPGGRMPSEDFSLLLREAETRLKDAAGRFSKRVQLELLTPKPRRKLPVVALVANAYIHRNRVRGVFEGARVLAAERLREVYIDAMEAFLRGRSQEMGEIFASRANLDLDVKDRATRMDDLIGELLNRPQLLAEAVIRDAKLNKEDITAVEIRTILGGYFNVTNSEVKSASELFDLDIVGIYDVAYARLNVFRQLVLRFAGRHESLRTSYVRRFGPSRTRVSYADAGDGGAPSGGRTRAEPQEAPGIRVQGMGNRRRPATGVQMGAALRPPKPKLKSPQEVDRAWQDFDEAISIVRRIGDEGTGEEFEDIPDNAPDDDEDAESNS